MMTGSLVTVDGRPALRFERRLHASLERTPTLRGNTFEPVLDNDGYGKPLERLHRSATIIETS